MFTRRRTSGGFDEMNSVLTYSRNIYDGVVTVLKGMWVTIVCMFTKPTTVQYPDESLEIADGYRGIHLYDEVTCIACEMCVKACPADCITLESEGKAKKAFVTCYKIDYTKCLFCNLCVEVCPTKCLEMGKKYSLVSYDREGCVIEFASRKIETPKKEEEK